MASVYGLVTRVYTVLNPPKPEKESNPLRFGILGAARIAPIALILAARSHPGVEVAAVAARDELKARTFAKKHGIAKIYHGPRGYQELIMDPDIDAIYNPLPNGLHFEWAAKALAAGKHVLLEKPSTDTAEETRKLFELARERGLVLLEAFHYRFHPAFRRFREIVDSGELGKVKSLKSELELPSGIVKNDNMRFDFDLGGGSLMDLGVYPISAVRATASAEPTSVITATHTAHPRDANIDRAGQATFAFPNDVTAEVVYDLRQPWILGIIPRWPNLHITATLEGGEVRLFNYPGAWIYHSITVTPKAGKKRVEKAYKPKEGKGEEWWSTYRYQLEAFVDQVRGRTPDAWMSEADSVDQMKAVEMVYQKFGLPVRPSSNYVI